jgi:hypothetical protein
MIKLIGRVDKADFPELSLENIDIKVDTGPILPLFIVVILRNLLLMESRILPSRSWILLTLGIAPRNLKQNASRKKQ